MITPVVMITPKVIIISSFHSTYCKRKNDFITIIQHAADQLKLSLKKCNETGKKLFKNIFYTIFKDAEPDYGVLI